MLRWLVKKQEQSSQSQQSHSNTSSTTNNNESNTKSTSKAPKAQKSNKKILQFLLGGGVVAQDVRFCCTSFGAETISTDVN